MTKLSLITAVHMMQATAIRWLCYSTWRRAGTEDHSGDIIGFVGASQECENDTWHAAVVTVQQVAKGKA